MVMRKQRVACVLVVCLVLALGDPGHLWPGSGSSSLLVQAKVPRAIVPQHSRLLGIWDLSLLGCVIEAPVWVYFLSMRLFHR